MYPIETEKKNNGKKNIYIYIYTHSSSSSG